MKCIENITKVELFKCRVPEGCNLDFGAVGPGGCLHAHPHEHTGGCGGCECNGFKNVICELVEK